MRLVGGARKKTVVERVDVATVGNVHTIDRQDRGSTQELWCLTLRGCWRIRVCIGHYDLTWRRGGHQNKLRAVTGGRAGLRKLEPLIARDREMEFVLRVSRRRYRRRHQHVEIF